jgi:hypothetical protein
MLIESAFQYLPEILCGSSYQAQKFEAGITNAFSLALLQELNARNVPNPLGALCIELLYSNKKFKHPYTNEPKFDRCDLYVDLMSLNVTNDQLERFGWRHRNYMEAKFFRASNMNITTNPADLMTDILRLCCLVRPQRVAYDRWVKEANTAKAHKMDPPKQTVFVPYEESASQDGVYEGLCVGRYLLHVYLGNVRDYIQTDERPWADRITSAGTMTLKINLSKKGERTIVGNTNKKGVKAPDQVVNPDEPPSYRNRVGHELTKGELEITITNRVLEQRDLDGQESYTCVLTRIDGFKITLNGWTYEETADRVGREGKPGDWTRINEFVGAHLNVPQKTVAGPKAGQPTQPDEKWEYDLSSVAPSTSEWLKLAGLTGSTGSFDPGGTTKD